MKNIKLGDIKFVNDTTITIRKYRRRTTVPKQILEHLKLGDGDAIRWIIMKDGTVIVMNAGI
jgi:bifunctional DNA-binding transcriptional regulator/antitoxin component of YhaV-PrlF toxin-antitoxin module